MTAKACLGRGVQVHRCCCLCQTVIHDCHENLWQRWGNGNASVVFRLHGIAFTFVQWNNLGGFPRGRWGCSYGTFIKKRCQATDSGFSEEFYELRWEQAITATLRRFVLMLKYPLQFGCCYILPLWVVKCCVLIILNRAVIELTCIVCYKLLRRDSLCFAPPLFEQIPKFLRIVLH
jgi:hypothetical protein